MYMNTFILFLQRLWHGGTIDSLKVSDVRNEEGLVHVGERLNQSYVNTNIVASLSCTSTHAEACQVEDPGVHFR